MLRPTMTMTMLRPSSSRLSASASVRYYSEFLKGKNINVIGAATSAGQPISGTEEGPQNLRTFGLMSRISSLGWKVNDTGDVQLTPNEVNHPLTKQQGPGIPKNCFLVGTFCEKLHNHAIKNVSPNDFALFIGGDHCIPIGSINAMKTLRPKTHVVWVDAHADINTVESSPSKNIHGMPLAFLLGMVKESPTLPGFGWLRPNLDPSDIVYIGLRDVDPLERVAIREHKIKAFTMQDVDRYGIGKIMEMTLDYINGHNIHLSFDIDGLDPTVAPSTGTPVRAGLTMREGHYICEELAASKTLTSMDIVETNVYLSKENANLTLEAATSLVESALGKTIL